MRRRTLALAVLGSLALASGTIACARVWGFDDLTLAASTDGGPGDGTTIHDGAVEARTDGGMPTCASDTACAAACDGGASCAGWTVQANPVGTDPGGTNNYNAVWGSGPGDVYLSDDLGDVFHSTGNGAWTLQTNEPGGSLHCGALWGSGSTDVYAGFDQGILFHSTGGSWTQDTFPTMNGITSLWGSGSGDVYAAAGGILHSTGNQAWATEDAGGGSYGYVWGSGPTDIYAAGASGLLARSTGDGTWTFPQLFAGSTQGIPSALWGSSSMDVYAIGSDANNGMPAIFHSTGDNTWTEQASGAWGTASGIWGSGATDVYVVGGAGTILHSTGNGTWIPVPSGTKNTLNTVWGSSSTDVYVVGTGVILHGP